MSGAPSRRAGQSVAPLAWDGGRGLLRPTRAPATLGRAAGVGRPIGGSPAPGGAVRHPPSPGRAAARPPPAPGGRASPGTRGLAPWSWRSVSGRLRAPLRGWGALAASPRPPRPAGAGLVPPCRTLPGGPKRGRMSRRAASSRGGAGRRGRPPGRNAPPRLIGVIAHYTYPMLAGGAGVGCVIVYILPGARSGAVQSIGLYHPPSPVPVRPGSATPGPWRQGSGRAAAGDAALDATARGRQDGKQRGPARAAPKGRGHKKRRCKMDWHCNRPTGAECPLKQKPCWEELELIDCMTADCQYLKIEGFTREKTADTPGPAVLSEQ